MCVQLEAVERNETELNTIMEKKLAHQLRDVTEVTPRLYGNDLQIAERLLSRLLTFEGMQTGFGLTATQDAHFNEVGRHYHGNLPPPRTWEELPAVRLTVNVCVSVCVCVCVCVSHPSSRTLCGPAVRCWVQPALGYGGPRPRPRPREG